MAKTSDVTRRASENCTPGRKKTGSKEKTGREDGRNLWGLFNGRQNGNCRGHQNFKIADDLIFLLSGIFMFKFFSNTAAFFALQILEKPKNFLDLDSGQQVLVTPLAKNLLC